MLGKLVDDVARFAGGLRARRRVKLGAGPIKVNLGAGLHVAEGWIHVDGNMHAMFAGWPAPFLRRLYRAANTVQWLPEDEYLRRLREYEIVHHEMETGLPFADNSVDYVYSSHVLEHFFREDAERLVKEIHRVLRSGGRVRICVPDLDHAISLYRAGEKEAALAYFFEPAGAGYYRQHRYMYDFELLRRMLAQAGFTNVSRCAYRQGEVPDLDVLDNRPEETLYVEAVK